MKPATCFVKFAGVLGPERLGQELDVGPPVPKGGKHQADHADPVIELLAKPALLDQGGQVFAGGHDEPGVARRRWMAGAGLVVAEVQLAEQIELKLERQRGHFVKVECAAVGLGQLVGPVLGSFPAGGVRRVRRLVARRVRRPWPMLHGDERSLRVGPERMDQAGQERLARSGLADDQDRGPGRRDRGRQVDDLAPARIGADQADLPGKQLDALRLARGRWRRARPADDRRVEVGVRGD